MSQKNHVRKSQLKKFGEPYISDIEAWNLFDYHARYILAGLHRFYSMKRWGISPNDILEKAYKKRGLSLNDDYNKHEKDMDEASDEARAEWDGILREMIWAFDQIVQDFPDDPFTVWDHEESAKLKAQGKPPFTITKKDDLGTYYESNLPPLPNSVKKDMESYHERIKAGLHLYAEYFLDLWD